MANELDNIELDNLSMEKVKELKNAAVERLKESGELPMMQTSYQEGTHTSHTSHSTHSNSVEIEPKRRVFQG